MLRSYVVFPELKGKIWESWLLEKYPGLSHRAVIGGVWGQYVLGDICENPLGLSMEITKRILEFTDNRKDWIIEGKGGENCDLFWNTLERIRFDAEDILLWTSLLLPWWNHYEDDEENWNREFDYGELDNYRKYGFDSKLEMLISLWAYRMRNVLNIKDNEYSWVNSRGIKNILTANMHGDTCFHQYKETTQWEVYSPFWTKTLFVPRKHIGIMNQVYHSYEPSFFATFFRYAYERWTLREIMWEGWEKFVRWAEKLRGMLWNYGDAGIGSLDSSEMLLRTCTPIGGWGRYRIVHNIVFWPNYRDEENAYYEFRIWEEGSLEMWNMSTWNRDIAFYPEDCEHLLRWILHHCAHWHGRTSKSQILEMVKYIYSDKFREEGSGLGKLEFPQL